MRSDPTTTTPHDATPDPQLAAALRSLEGEPPLESVDWERLRGSIRSRAEMPLARLKREAAGQRAPARPAARFLRPALPLAAAASMALAVWVAAGGAPETGPSAALPEEEVFRPDLSDQEFRLLVSGGADPEALLLIALDGS